MKMVDVATILKKSKTIIRVQIKIKEQIVGLVC